MGWICRVVNALLSGVLIRTFDRLLVGENRGAWFLWDATEVIVLIYHEFIQNPTSTPYDFL